MKYPLHIALRQLVDAHSPSIYSDEKFMNFLSDFSEFNPPSLRHVLKSMAAGGYVQELCNKQMSGADWQLYVRESLAKIVRREGFEDRYVDYCFQCLAYGLRLTDYVDSRLVQSDSTESQYVEPAPSSKNLPPRQTPSASDNNDYAGSAQKNGNTVSQSPVQKKKSGLFFALLFCLLAILAYAGIKFWKNHKSAEEKITNVTERPVGSSQSGQVSTDTRPSADDDFDEYEDSHSRYDYVYSFSSSYRGMAKVEKGGKYGLIDKNGREVLKPVYDYLYSFSLSYGDMMKVEQDGKYGLIDESGKIVLSVEYDYLYSFSSSYGGLMKVEKNKKLGLVNKNGQIILPVAYDYIYNVSTSYDGMMRVEQNGLYGLVDKSGREVLPVKYDNIYSFKNGKAKVKYQGTDMEVDINS